MESRRGVGRFQWNSGGWFGAQLGSTFWLLGIGFSFLFQSRLLGVIFIGCFTASNAIGTSVWSNRHRIDPYAAIQALLIVILLFTTIAMISADAFGMLGQLDRRIADPRSIYLLLLMYPGMMLLFHVLNKKPSSESRTNS